jgi:hypothetical protein
MKNSGTIVFAVIIGLVIGFFAGQMIGNSPSGEVIKSLSSDGSIDLTTPNNIRTEQSADDNTNSPASTASENKGFVIKIDNLPEAQKVALRGLGVSGPELVVTEEIIVCAETEIGAPRLYEIRNGATPSISEGLKLISCYQ